MLDPQTLCPKCMYPRTSGDAPCPRCGTGALEVHNLSHQLACGTLLMEKYWVGAVLGQGGFGITYTGYDLALGIKVAIKEYYPSGIVSRNQPDEMVQPVHEAYQNAYARGRERFLQEARALARFSSERCVVNVREFFLANGTAYIVMDFVEGKTLKSVANAAGGKLPAKQVLSLMRPLIATLSRIHEAGVLHRDISPDNILLRPDGIAVLIDFGAARQISANGTHSLTINVKHGYAPEEQYRRRGKQGPWTDVYALCATIYRLTTGKKPPQALDRLVGNDSLQPPNDRGAGFTPAQQRALLQGLAIHAQDRPQTMKELYELLYAGSSGLSALLVRITNALIHPDPSGQVTKKQRNGVALLLVVLAVVAVGALVLMLRAAALQHQQSANLPAPVLTSALAETPAPNNALEQSPSVITKATPAPATATPTATSTPPPTPTPTATPKLPGYVISNELALRKRPTSEREDIFSTLHQGDVVDLINKQGNYYFVYVPDLDASGYVLSKYIETQHDGDIPHISSPTTPTPTPSPEPTPTPGIFQLDPEDGDNVFQSTLPPYAVITPSLEN